MQEREIEKCAYKCSFIVFLIFCGMLIIQMFSSRVVAVVGQEPFEHRCYNFPFVYGWCMIMEWMLPFLLCVGCMAVWLNHHRAYLLIEGIYIAGLIEIFCGKYGLKMYMTCTSDELVFLSTSTGYWEYVHPKVGFILPIYFQVWSLCGLIWLNLFSKKIMSIKAKGKQSFQWWPIFLLLLCLGEGIIFNYFYMGEYTLFYIIRNLLLFVIISIPYRYQMDCRGEKVYRSKSNISKFKNILCICVIGHIVLWGIGLYVMYLTYGDMLTTSFWTLLISKMPRYACRNYAVFQVAVASMYIVERNEIKRYSGWLAVLCSTSFLVQWYLTHYDLLKVYDSISLQQNVVIGIKICLITGCIILYLLFQWLWKYNQWTDIFFLTVIYMLAVAGTFIERMIIYRERTCLPVDAITLLLYLFMYGVSICTRLHVKDQSRKIIQDKRQRIIWCMALIYSQIVLFDILYQSSIMFPAKLGISYRQSMLRIILDGCENVPGAYAVAFFSVITYLAYALDYKELEIFCVISFFATVFYSTVTTIVSLESVNYVMGFSIDFVVILIILIVFMFLNVMYPFVKKKLGRICLAITYSICFYKYSFPFFKNFKLFVQKYPNSYIFVYIVGQSVLMILMIITIIAFGRREDVIMSDGTLWEVQTALCFR